VDEEEVRPRSPTTNNAVKALVTVLLREYGNKRYLYDFETLLSRLTLSPEDEQTLYFLAQDLSDD